MMRKIVLQSLYENGQMLKIKTMKVKEYKHCKTCYNF